MQKEVYQYGNEESQEFGHSKASATKDADKYTILIVYLQIQIWVGNTKIADEDWEWKIHYEHYLRNNGLQTSFCCNIKMAQVQMIS